MCLLWFSLCHRHYQEDKAEDGRGEGQRGLFTGVGAAGPSTGARSPAVGSWGLPSSLTSPRLVSPTGHQCPSSQEEELSWALLPQRRKRRRRRQAGSWRLSLSAAFRGMQVTFWIGQHEAELRSSEVNPAAP